MCCLFGLLDYKQQLSLKQRQRILRTLSMACEDRGTDATGIAFFTANRLNIQKAPKPARRMKFRIPGSARYIMGHTRMTTQGDGTGRKNYNNHPFAGQSGHTAFALAHNGVLHNDRELRVQKHLPHTKIETDSYVAVQLLEQEGQLNFTSLGHMAETVRGSFTFTVLDDRNNLYIVKGNNPICIYHYEKAGFYLYASTQEILEAAVQGLGLSKAPHQVVPMKSGEILRISPDGTQTTTYFNDEALWCADHFYGLGWYGGHASLWSSQWKDAAKEDEASLLEEHSSIGGIDKKVIQALRSQGYDWLEIEEMIYDPELLDACMMESLYG